MNKKIKKNTLMTKEEIRNFVSEEIKKVSLYCFENKNSAAI